MTPAQILAGPHVKHLVDRGAGFSPAVIVEPLKIVGHNLWLVPRIYKLKPPYMSPLDSPRAQLPDGGSVHAEAR